MAELPPGSACADHDADTGIFKGILPVRDRVILRIEWFRERTEHLNRYISFFPPSRLSAVLFTGRRGVSDFSVL